MAQKTQQQDDNLTKIAARMELSAEIARIALDCQSCRAKVKEAIEKFGFENDTTLEGESPDLRQVTGVGISNGFSSRENI